MWGWGRRNSSITETPCKNTTKTDTGLKILSQRLCN